MGSHLKAWKDEYSRSTWKGPYSIEVMKRLLTPGARVLDTGCGNGKLLAPLERAGFAVTGIDLSRDALLSIKSEHHGLIEGDVINLPFKDGTFDAVVCHDVLQHLMESERVEAIMEMKRALADRGVLFLEVFGKEDMRYGGEEVEQDTFRRQSGIIYHYFTEREVICLLEGFEVLGVENTVTEKTFSGEKYVRHRISAVSQKKPE